MIQLGVSACLLGERVRYDGGHKRDHFVADVLARYYKLVPMCPEMAIGLGTPRPTIRLMGDGSDTRAISQHGGAEQTDVTARLEQYGVEVAHGGLRLGGYVLKSRSPSCGMERVKIYHANGQPYTSSSGIYARTLMREWPLLPIEEEGRLNDEGLRASFLDRVSLYDAWLDMQAQGVSPARLVDLHTSHKFILLAYNQSEYRRLGRLVARAGEVDIEPLAREYIEIALAAMRKPARPGSHVNVLEHMLGFLTDRLERGDRDELLEAIDAFRRGEAPITVALTLMRHHLRRQPESYLHSQRYLRTRPLSLLR